MMRSGRKSGAAINVSSKPLPIRNCTVRVVKKSENSSTTSATNNPIVTLPKLNNSIQTQGNWRNTSTPVSEEKKFRGPIKKRPITQITTTSPVKSNINTSTRSGNVGNTSSNKSPVVRVESPPVTIAAGRSRRAIKPNPKYASEDMVTPRILKSVTSSGFRGDGDKSGRQRSGSSVDDFFSRDSSDEVDGDFDDLIGKVFRDSDKEYNDTDYESLILDNSTINRSTSTTPATVPRKRGRPRREPVNSPIDNNVSAVPIKPTTATKNELLAKAISARHAAVAQKRAAEKNTGGEFQLTRKRFLLSAEGHKLKALSEHHHENNKTLISNSTITATTTTSASATTAHNASSVEVGAPTAAPTINKMTSYRLKEILDEALGSEVEESDDDMEDDAMRSASKRNQISQEMQENLDLKKPADSKLMNVKLLAKKTTPVVLRTRLQQQQQQEQNMQNKQVYVHGKNSLNTTPNSQTQIAGNNSNNSSTNSNNSSSNNNNNNNKSSNEKNMPTFTIVNINDIINKKGDVLISKSSTSSQESNKSNKAQTANGRQDSLQQQVFRKVTGPTILNHQIANRQANQVSNVQKAAPRILNAMVAKKTQPVKPTTQNPNDSADEIYTLSLDEDEETEDETNNTFVSLGTDGSFNDADNSGDEQPTRKATTSQNSVTNSLEKLSPRSQVIDKRSSGKDNTSNQSLNVRSLPPERIEICRLGDKVVKKITCLENWFVIERPKECTEVMRNLLDMPLIELANSATSLKLPSKHWNSKVTLYELPAATLAKNTFTTYVGSLSEHKIAEEDRVKYQPSCVMFRRAVEHKEKSRLPYDRAVIFKNKTFYTNIEGKNVRLIGAPNSIDKEADVEILLDVIDNLTLQCSIVETTGSL